MLRRLPIPALILAPAAAWAAPTPAEPRSFEQFAAANAACLEWSDGCVVCRRQDKTFACSTPGIACTPVQLACRATTPPTPESRP